MLEHCWVVEMFGASWRVQGSGVLSSSHLPTCVEYFSTLTASVTQQLDGSGAALFSAVLPLPALQTPNLPLLLVSGPPLPLSS